MKQKAKLELDVRDFEDSVREEEDGKKAGGKELEKLEKKILEKEDELAEIAPQFQEKKAMEEEFQTRYDLQLRS